MCVTLLYDVRPMIVWLTDTAISPAPTPPISRPRHGVGLPPSSLPNSTLPSQNTAKTSPALPSAVGRCMASSDRPNKIVDRASA